jgi:DNA repair exonuclease SbcCD ATPase subunit
MRLVLTNMMCYSGRHEFLFADTGTVLLTGQSGCGKTSIVRAIMFALFGVGVKLQTHGQLSCRVELTGYGLHIVRTKGPNHLVVDGIHEDDAGQLIITDTMGGKFDQYGYVRQGMAHNFLALSPSQKMAMMERVVFDHDRMVAMKARIQSDIKSTRIDIIDHRARLDALTELDEQMRADADARMPFPTIRVADENGDPRLSETYDDARVMIDQAKARNAVSIASNTQTIERLDRETLDVRAFEAIETADASIRRSSEASVERLLTGYDESFDDDASALLIAELRDKLRYMRASRKRRRCLAQRDALREALDAMRSTERQVIRTQISRLETRNLRSDDLTERTQTLRQALRIAEVIELDERALTRMPAVGDAKLDELEADVKAATSDLGGVCYTCPSCATTLAMGNGMLMKCEGRRDDGGESDSTLVLEARLKRASAALTTAHDANERANTIRTNMARNIATRGSDLRTVSQLNAELARVLALIDERAAGANELARLRVDVTNDAPTTPASAKLITKMTAIDAKLNELGSVRPQPSSTHIPIDVVTEDDTTDAIASVVSKRAEMGRVDALIAQLRADIGRADERVRTRRRRHITTHGSVRPSDDVARDVDVARQRSSSLAELTSSLTTSISELDRWRSNDKLWTRIDERADTMVSARSSIDTMVCEHTSMRDVLAHVVATEARVMRTTIDTLNAHVRRFIDAFFDSDPGIAVALDILQHTDSKPEITVVVELRGETVPLKTLSGGEMSRVALAFSLSLAEMLNAPLIILDECTSNLDQNATDAIFEFIASRFHSRQIIAIAHQVVTGSFDSVIRLPRDTNTPHLTNDDLR